MRYLLCLALLVTIAYSSYVDLSAYPNSKVLSDFFTLHWRLDLVAKEIYLALEAKTLGWVGFGLGERTSGSMPGADIVTGTVINGVASVQDRFSLAYVMPKEDSCQNWVLISGVEQNGKTIIEIKRKFNTQDTQDREIVEGENRIIYAIGSSDTFSYHGTNRGASIINFLNPTESIQIKNVSADATAVFTMPNFNVPSKSTSYICKSFSLPTLTDGHVVQIDPIIVKYPGKADFVHHMLIHVCEPSETKNPAFWDKYQNPGECSSPLGDVGTGCISLMWAWAVGMNSIVLPQDAGFRIGTSSPHGIKHIVVEIHYNNVEKASNIFDSSGIRIHYTTALRKYDAGVMTLGDPLTRLPSIPPGLPDNKYETNCPTQCTSKWTHDINVFSDFQHMHYLGKQLVSTHWRGDQMLGYLNRVDFYQFDFQQGTPLNYVIKKGDRINTHCRFDSTTRTTTTRFSLGSYDEMCMEFISYYPLLLSPNSRPYVFCGYVNYGIGPATICGDNTLQSVLNIKNPTVVDPASVTTISFGNAPSQCPRGSL
eukprot:TRINITY_DN13883_c0_g1_i1.p1 TRINITY_DN13883_c0_g1~~TRINITY_DN13883_c0_g1_i1.p1  ORF type:complete len:538 (+),score=55.78 TRINITY_DN13883_c0_g1_i1:127-1740(+)